MPGKANVGARASQFLSQIGTAGGPVGAMNSPNLVAFGAGDLQSELLYGATDPYAAARMNADPTVIGSPAQQGSPALHGSASMPANLDSAYLHLNVPGSPLPMYGLMAAHNANAAHVTQQNIRAMDQRMFTGALPMLGQLPIGPAVAAAQQLGAKAAQQRARK
jgi:hypothetical protein